MPNRSLIHALARAFLAGDPSVEEIVARAGRMLGRSWRWLRPLARRYVREIEGRPRPRRRDVVAFLLRDPGFALARAKYRRRLSIDDWLTEPQRMQPVAAAAAWD